MLNPQKLTIMQITTNIQDHTAKQEFISNCINPLVQEIGTDFCFYPISCIVVKCPIGFKWGAPVGDRRRERFVELSSLSFRKEGSGLLLVPPFFIHSTYDTLIGQNP